LKLNSRILSYLKPHLGVSVASVAASSAYALLNGFSLILLIPFLGKLFQADGADAGAAAAGGDVEMLERLLDATVGRFVDLQADPMEALRGIILFLLVVYALKNIADFLRRYLMAWVEQGVSRDLRNEVYEHLLDLDLAFFGRTRMGQIVSRLTHDVEQLRTLATRELSNVVSAFLNGFVMLGYMLLVSVELTVWACVAIPATVLIWGPFLRKLRRRDRRVLGLAGEVSHRIQETLSGIRLVKASSAESHERTRFRDLTQSYFKQVVRTERLRSLAPPMTEMVAAIGTIVVIWIGAGMVLGAPPVLEANEFLGFLTLSVGLYSPVKYLGKFPALVQPGLVGAERVFEFLDSPIEIRDEDGAVPFEGLTRDITFEDVGFEYRNGDPVLRDVSFRAEMGSVVALVGRSGSGKTTIVDLLARFYDVTEGRIQIDGSDIRGFTVDSLRRSLGIVSQDTVLFHETVRANLCYGMESVSEEEMESAAEAAFAAGFIAELPDGYDTVVGERGTQLSGGQRQRIAIARAILRDPPILIFDEATSSLDTESERVVQRAVERLLAGRTVFVIAHRLSTVQRADQILVVRDGQIVERGRHEELIEAAGEYRRLHDLQFSEDSDPLSVSDENTDGDPGASSPGVDPP